MKTTNNYPKVSPSEPIPRQQKQATSDHLNQSTAWRKVSVNNER